MSDPRPEGGRSGPEGAADDSAGDSAGDSSGAELGAEAGRLSSRVVHDGRIVHLSVDTVRFPDGSTGELELVRHPGAAAVLPLLGSRDDPDPEVLLIRQYRYATGGDLYEVPAGIPESPDEPWEACARRELEEETGHRAATLHYLSRIYTTPGFCDEVIHLFLGEGLEEGRADRDADEFLEVVPMPFSRALELVRTGELADCKSVACVLYAHSFVFTG